MNFREILDKKDYKTLSEHLTDADYYITTERLLLAFYFDKKYYLFDSDLDNIVVSDYQGYLDDEDIEDLIKKNKENGIFELTDLDKQILKEFFILEETKEI